MTISIRLNKEEENLIKSYAQLKNKSVSDILKSALIQKIEEEYDLALYNISKKEFTKNPKKYTLDEVEKKLKLK